MGKRFIVLADGTGNAASSTWRSNVWRLFESLERSSDQIILYDEGIGTSRFPPANVLGRVFGVGLKRKVLHLYEFICRTYDPSQDEIYFFGFSRGAFIINLVVGIIAEQGLVRFSSEAELHRRAIRAYNAYRTGSAPTRGPARFLTALFGDRAYQLSNNKPVPRIRFVGLWDTVAAYGMPIEEMAVGISRWAWPLSLPNRSVSSCVQRACHALSLDDERTTFRPILWNESAEPPPSYADGRRYVGGERISQVWFAGAHANVGGGYPDDSLAHVSLCWMMEEARLCGLKFKSPPKADPDYFLNRQSMRDERGRIYDPRSGLGAFYRYGPRKVTDLCAEAKSYSSEVRNHVDRPKIHHSVFDRVREATDSYHPVGIPSVYDVVAADGEILSLGDRTFEAPEAAKVRAELQERAWNLIWYRRILYFGIVGITLWMLMFPLLFNTPRAAEFSSSLRPVSDSVRIVGGFLPGAFSLWINEFARNPGIVLICGILAAFFVALDSRLRTQIRDESSKAWKNLGDVHLVAKGWTYRFRTSTPYTRIGDWLRRQVAPNVYGASLALLSIFLSVALINRIALIGLDAAGFYCESTDGGLRDLSHLEVCRERDTSRCAGRTVLVDTRNLCTSTGVFVETNARYEITISQQNAADWQFAGLPSDLEGMPISRLGRAGGLEGRGRELLGSLAYFFKRSLDRPLGRVIIRYGSVGNEEYFIDPGVGESNSTVSERFRSTKNGELFIYLNQPILAIWPGLTRYINSGIARVTVVRVPRF